MDEISVSSADVIATITRPTTAKSILALFLFTVINVLNYVDRYVLPAVLTNVQNYFQIDDTKAGLLQTAFIIVYMISAPVAGYLGDRCSRKYILMSGVGLWAVFTLLGSFVPDNAFWLFLTFRALVGIGESAYITVCIPLIGDFFSESNRLIAITIFSLAGPVGAALGYIFGTGITSFAEHFGANPHNSWQYAFRVTPALSVPAIFSIWLFLPEPPRGFRDVKNSRGGEMIVRSSLKEDLKYLLSNKTCVFATLGATTVIYILGCLSFWCLKFVYAAYEISDLHVEKSILTLYLSASVGVTAVLGGVVGSFLVRSIVTYRRNAEPVIAAFGMIIAGPILFFLAVGAEFDPRVIWPCIVIGCLAICCNWSIAQKILIDCVVPSRRAIVAGLSTMFVHLFGDAYSPLMVGVLADVTYGTDTSYDQFKGLQVGLLSCPIVAILGSALFFACAICYDDDKRKTMEAIEGRIRVNQSEVSISNSEHEQGDENYDGSFVPIYDYGDRDSLVS